MNLIDRLFKRNELVLISTLIVQAAEEYQKNALVAVSNKVDDIPCEVISEMTRLKSEMNILQAIGLNKSKNFKLLQRRYIKLDEQVKEFNTQTLNRKKAKELIEYIKLLKKLNPNSFLIPEDLFKDICKKYNLRTDFLTNYTGTIPERNIQELFKVEVKDFEFNSDIYYITAVYEVDSFLKKKCIESEFDKNGRFVHGNKHYNPISNLIKELREEYDVSSLDLQYIGINEKSFLIACPKDQLKKQKLIFSNKSIDPIVFQYCPYGIVAHTIWGEEAEDSVLNIIKR